MRPFPPDRSPRGRRKRERPRAFTLVEIVVVAAILAILVALLVPAGKAAMRAGQDAKCKSNLRQLGIAYFRYAQDHDGFILSDDSSPNEWTRLIQPYIGHPNFYSSLPKLLRCPASPLRTNALFWQPDYAANIHGGVFSTNGLSTSATAGKMLVNQSRPNKVMLFLDWIPGWAFARVFEFSRVNNPSGDKDRVFRHSGKLNAVFGDGHVEPVLYPISTNYSEPPWK